MERFPRNDVIFRFRLMQPAGPDTGAENATDEDIAGSVNSVITITFQRVTSLILCETNRVDRHKPDRDPGIRSFVHQLPNIARICPSLFSIAKIDRSHRIANAEQRHHRFKYNSTDQQANNNGTDRRDVEKSQNQRGSWFDYGAR
jgi:hypothetical protein